MLPGHLRSEAVCMVSPVADVTQQVPVLVAGLAAVLTGFALLALPAAADPLRDLDVVPAVEVVLAARGAVQQVAQLGRRQLCHLADLPLVAGVVEVGRGGRDLGHLVVAVHPDHGQTRLLHEAAAGHGAGPVVHLAAGLAGHGGAVVFAGGAPFAKNNRISNIN